MPWQNNGGSGGPWGNGENPGPPKNPWGGNQPQRGPSGGDKGPDFDDFIKRSQERLRNSLGGGGGGGGRSGGGGNMPWGFILGGILAAWIVFTSSYRVGPQEAAVVLRFGKYVETTGPGFHLKAPAPIDTVIKRRVQEVSSIDIGAGDAGENLMLTGDQNIINVAYTVRWKISDPVLYLFELAEPETTVREVAESAMRAEVGQVSMNAAIGPQRAQIADQVRNRMQELLNSYKAGIEVVGVDIRQADPPNAVDDAFKQVSAAQQQAQQALNQSRAYQQQLIAKAQGDAAVFNAVYAQYRLAPEVTRKRIYLETMEKVLEKNGKTVVEARGVTPYLPLPELKRRAGTPAEGAAQ